MFNSRMLYGDGTCLAGTQCSIRCYALSGIYQCLPLLWDRAGNYSRPDNYIEARINICSYQFQDITTLQI